MTTLNIPIVKAKETIPLDTNAVPEDVFAEAVAIGFKVLLNRGATKITATAYPSEDDRRAAAMEAAKKQLEMVMTSKIKFTGGKVKKATGAIMTEARRIAREIVKNTIKSNGGKVSHYKSSEITRIANAVIEADPEIVKQAEANLRERSKAPVAIDITSMIHEDPELVRKAAAAKAAKRKPKAQHAHA